MTKSSEELPEVREVCVSYVGLVVVVVGGFGGGSVVGISGGGPL